MSGWIAFTVLALVANLLADARGDRLTFAAAKVAASTGFVATALAGGALGSSYGVAILASLVACWIGDVCLLSKQQGFFLAGLSAFLVGHLGFAIAFGLQGPRWIVVAIAAALLAIPARVVLRWLDPKLPGEMKVPVLAYIVVITAMVSLAIGFVMAGGPRTALVGATMFYLSDLSVARDRFVVETFLNRVWGHPLYFIGQLFLAASVA
jgi:uncharacterized membrane protein YhhN